MFPNSYLTLHLPQRGEGDKIIPTWCSCMWYDEMPYESLKAEVLQQRSFLKSLPQPLDPESGIRMGASSPIKNLLFWKAVIVLLDE